MKNIRRTTKIFVFGIFCVLNVEAMQESFVTIGATDYQTLHDAVNNAVSGNILTILKNMEITQEISVKGKSITIQPEGDIVLRRGYDYDGHLFNIYNDASLTLKTNLKDENNRLVIDGDWKSNFIIDKNGKQVHLDENAPLIPAEHRKRQRTCTYITAGQRPIYEHVEFTGQHYVVADDGRRLYIDGDKRILTIEKSREQIFIYRDLRQFINPVGPVRALFLREENEKYFKNDAGQKIVEGKVLERQVDGCIIVNYEKCMINGNVIICNNYNLQKFINFDCIYTQSIPYGAVYNHGTFDMLRCYIGWNYSNGVFNAENTIFHMHDGGIFKNFAYHGAGVFNYGKFHMHGGKISTNRAYFHGAGVYNRGNFNMPHGTISANETDFSYDNCDVISSGGGIYNGQSGVLTIKNGIIEKNASKNGGGIYNKGRLDMIGVVISKNAALAVYYAVHTFVLQGIWTGITEDDVIIGYKIYDIPGQFFGNGGGIHTTQDSNANYKTRVKNNIQKHCNDIFILKDFQHITELNRSKYDTIQ